MMKVKPMRKITVFGPKTFMKNVIEELYNMNVVHIEDFTKKSEKDVFDIGEPFEKNERYAELLVKVRTLISNLNISNNKKVSNVSLSDIEKNTEPIYDNLSTLFEKKEYFEQIIKTYSKKEVEKALKNLKIEIEKDVDYSKLLHFIGFVNTVQDDLKEKVEKISKKYILHSTNYEGISLIALFIEKNKKQRITKLLEKYDFSAIDTPVTKKQYKLKSKSGVRFVKLNNEENVVTKKLEKLESEIKQLKIENTDFLLQAEKKLTVETDKAEAPLKFATTKNTFLIKGWLPKKNVKKLDDSLNEITNGKVMINIEKPKKKDNVPVAFNHPKIVEPFEAFMDLYTLPSYKEIDPTFFMFLTFPFFFGFMLGDVGYGLVTLALFTFLKKKMPGAKNLLNAFIIASISSIIFGMVFGEYFGYENVTREFAQTPLAHAIGIHPEELHHHGETVLVYTFPRLFSRSHGDAINNLLSISLVFGLTHLLLGYIIGFVNILKAHGLKHAIMEKAGWILIMPFILWLLLNFLGIIKGFVADMLNAIMPSFTVIIALFVVGTLLVIKGEGIIGLIEVVFFALLSNVLSYARLMAVGLASLSLAVVINDMAGSMFSSGFFGIIMGIFVLVLGHTINIALGILSPFLHSLRLHYVEFFGKFFKGGGRKYQSFGYSE